MSRGLLKCIPVAALMLCFWGCQTVPSREYPVTPDSSVLAVMVEFPPSSKLQGFLMTASGPFLSGVAFLKAPLDGELRHATELVSASWIKGPMAYLFNPEPGTYFVAAVTYVFKMPSTSTSGSLGGGFTGSISTGGTTSGDTLILPIETIRKTRTTIGPGQAEFAGTQQIMAMHFGLFKPTRISASTEFEGDLEMQIAELVQPGVTELSGLAALFAKVLALNPSASLMSNEPSDRERFLNDAQADFKNSPWEEVIRRLDEN